MLRIAIVSPYPIDAPGGVQRHILDFYLRLKELGFYVKIISPSKDYQHEDHIRVGTSYKVQGELFGNGATTYFPRTRLFKFKAKLKEEFDIIHVHEPLLIPPFFYGYRILKQNKARYIAHIHAMNPIFEEQEIFLNPMIKKIMSSFNAIIASSKVSAKPYEIVGKKVHIVPNGVEVRKLNPHVKKLPEYLDGKKNILFIGRFDERKGLRYLLEAWPIITAEFQDNVRLIIAGKGSENDENDVQEKLESLPQKQNVVFEGYVTEERKAALYATADIFCSPATGRESFGMVLNEAMAAGTPVVAFDNPGYRTVLEKKEKYCLARLYDILDLSKKIVRILRDPKLENKLIEWGLQEVEQKYDWEVVSKQVIKIYEQVLRQKFIEVEKNQLLDLTGMKEATGELYLKLQKILET